MTYPLDDYVHKSTIVALPEGIKEGNEKQESLPFGEAPVITVADYILAVRD